MQLSVVIVSYNAKYFLELCLLSVKKAIEKLSAEIIVVDNASTDGSCQLIKDKFKDIRLIENNQNLGFAKANNLGVSKASGEFILILNPDTVVAEDTFSSCLQFAESHPDMGALGVKLIDGTGHFLPESKRNLPTLKGTFNKIFEFESKKHSYYANHINENALEKVSILVGAFMFLKRETYLKVGGFDPDYFMYGEDIDLSYKLIKSGFQNYYLGNLSVLHFKGESTQKDVKYLKYFFGAMSIFHKKHFKSNIVLKWFLKFGTMFWFIVKYLQIKFRNSDTVKGKKAIYLGNNQDYFNIIKNYFNSLDFVKVTTAELLENKKVNLLFIDLKKISFKLLIKLLQQHKNNFHKFRICVPNSDIILGSESASDKGIVIPLN